LLAPLLVLLHCGLRFEQRPGGHALLAMAVVVGAGVVGRWFYAFVPRAANGRELELAEARGQLAALSAEWDRSGAFGERVRELLEPLGQQLPWRASLPGRAWALLRSQATWRQVRAALRHEAHSAAVPGAKLQEVEALARRAHRLTLMATHFEDLRALLGTWRYLHRWLALLLVLLVAVHVASALRFADLFAGASAGVGGGPG
jgi:hypothetical protein